MSGSMNSAASAEPNLTPMLDMVFQLITFFMLVSNFQSASLDLSLKLPVVGSARPVDTEGTEDLLILKTTGSGFENFLRDEFTTLPETGDRIFATKLKATWTYTRKPKNYSATNEKILAAMLATFQLALAAALLRGRKFRNKRFRQHPSQAPGHAGQQLHHEPYR